MAENAYREFVAEYLPESGGGPTKVMSNKNPAHAAAFLEELIRGADEVVEILASELPTGIFEANGVVRAAKELLDERKGTIKLLLESEPKEGEKKLPFVRLFWNGHKPEGMELRYVPQDLQKRYRYSFVVNDSNSYRFEEDRGEGVVFAQFKDPEMGELLKTRFMEIWDRSHKLAPQPAE